MRAKTTIISTMLVLIAAYAGATTAMVPEPNDAGSDADASDDPTSPEPWVKPGVTYTGNLTPPADADWYGLDVTGSTYQSNPVCLDLFAVGPAHSNVTLGSINGGVGKNDTDHRLNPTTPLRLALVISDARDFLIGFEPASVDKAPVDDEISVGEYMFSAELFTKSMVETGPGDGGTAGDAGPNRTTAKEVPAPCFGGTLDSSKGDKADAYTIEALPGYTLEYSLGKGNSTTKTISMTIISPEGEVVDTIQSGGQNSTLITGSYDIPAVEDVNGTSSEWLILIEGADASGVYLASVTANDGEWPPCRPHCESSLSSLELS